MLGRWKTEICRSQESELTHATEPQKGLRIESITTEGGSNKRGLFDLSNYTSIIFSGKRSFNF